jgi:MoxR-like ATPase
MKPSKALQIMKSVLKGGNTPFLIGGTGVGKSAVVRQLVDELAGDREVVVDCINPDDSQFGFIDFRLSMYESVDLGGLPYIDSEGDSDLAMQKRAFLGNLPVSGAGIMFFDEYGQSHSSMQAVAGQINYERRIGEYCLPDGWKIICASNRHTDRAGSNKLPSHVIGRTSIIDFEHDTNDWLDWAIRNDVHEDILGFITYQPEWLNSFDAKVLTPQPSPRSWTRLSDTLKTKPPEELLQAIAETDVGETAAIEFHTFVSLKLNVPNLDDIVNGEDVEIADSNGLMYATIVGLVSVIKDASDLKVNEYFENALAYIDKFPTPEYGIFFVRSICSSRAELRETATYASFKVKHQDLEV